MTLRDNIERISIFCLDSFSVLMSHTQPSEVSSSPNGYPGDNAGGALTLQWKQLKYFLLEQEENFPPEVQTELLLLLLH